MSNFGDMDPDEKFPGVVDLNVNGVEHRTLLSTLIKDENSLLAAMFTGQHPVYKDGKGRYFLHANPQTFHFILHFLHYDEFPFHKSEYGGRGLFGGFGAGVAGNFNENDLKAIYADSVKLRLSSLTQRLELYKPILTSLKMEEYKKSVNCYDELLKKILSTIRADVMYHETVYVIRLDQDFQTTYQDKCCEHECKHANLNIFSQVNNVSINETVKAPCEVTLTLLSALIKDLLHLGYSVQGLVASCGFHCKKSIRQPKYFMYSDQVKKCCGEEMLLIMFKFVPDQNVLYYPNMYGQKGCFKTPYTLFGQQNEQKGANFFGSSSQGFSFGGGQGSQSAFGGSQGSQSVFGAGQGPQSAFGGGQGSQSAFGGGQGSQSAFDGGQESQSVFGGGQGPQSAFDGGQGSQSTFGGGQGSQSAFGGSQGSQSAFGGGQGSQSAFGGGQGSQISFGGGGQGSQSTVGGSLGSQSAFGGGQGSQSGFGVCQGSQTGFGQGFSFGNKFSFDTQQKQEFSNSSSSNQARETSLFGMAKPVSKAEDGSGLFGSSQQAQNASGNITFKLSQLSQSTNTGFSFGKQTPVLQGSTFSTQKQDARLGSQATAVFGVPTSTPACGNTFSGGFKFNTNQQTSTNRLGHLFGGKATFTSPVKMPNLQQPAFKADGVKTENAPQGEPVIETQEKGEESSTAEDNSAA